MTRLRTVSSLSLTIGILLSLGMAQVVADCTAPPIPTTQWFMKDYTSWNGAGSHLDHVRPAGLGAEFFECSNCAVRGNETGDANEPGPMRVYSEDPVPLSQDFYRSSSSTSAKVWITGPQNGTPPAPNTKVTIQVFAGTTVVASGSTEKQSSTTKPIQFDVTLSNTGNKIDRGSKIHWEVFITDTQCASQEAVGGCYNPGAVPIYGSAYAWNFVLGFGPVPAPPIRMNVEPNATLTAPPGGSAPALINITNFGNLCQYQINLTAVSSLPVSFPRGDSVVVYEQTAESLAVVVRIPNETAVGTVFNITLDGVASGPALFGAESIGSVNLTMTVRAPGPGEGPVSTNSNSGKNGLPGPTFGATVIFVAFLAFALRRRFGR